MSIKNSNDAIGNRTRDLPACSAVSQPSAPPRVKFGSSSQIFGKFVVPWSDNSLPDGDIIPAVCQGVVAKCQARPTAARLTSSTQERPSLPFCGTLVIQRKEESISSVPFKTR